MTSPSTTLPITSQRIILASPVPEHDDEFQDAATAAADEDTNTALATATRNEGKETREKKVEKGEFPDVTRRRGSGLAQRKGTEARHKSPHWTNPGVRACVQCSAVQCLLSTSNARG
jgi:hypothetical protein